MKFDTRAFFTELSDSDVDGFAVIETDSTEGYRMAEKWNRPERDGGPTWLTYWIPEEALLDRIQSGKCKQTTTLSHKQYRGVLKLADVFDEVETNTVAA